MHTQSLSFWVRLARTPQDLEAACRVRAESYGHHLPSLQATLIEPDLLDSDESTAVAICVDKESGRAIGTARIQTNAISKLLIEYSVTLPESMRNDTRAEISRLSAVPGADPLVKLSLIKASYLFCVAKQIRWAVISARNDALVRQYQRLGFADVFDDERMVDLLHVGRMGHRILRFNVTAGERMWSEARHRLYEFFADTVHPDIDLFTTRPALAQRAPFRTAVPRIPFARPSTRLPLREQVSKGGSFQTVAVN